MPHPSRLLLSLVFALAPASTLAQAPPFNRFTDELSELLEADANAVMIRGITHDFAGKLCGRLGNETSELVKVQVAEWRTRNDPFFRGAVSAIAELGDRHLPGGGEAAKQDYFQKILHATARVANQRLIRQLNGATLDNSVVPPERACSGLANFLRDRAGDFDSTPDVTRALLPYMAKKGISK